MLIFCMDTIYWVSRNLEHVEGIKTDFVSLLLCREVNKKESHLVYITLSEKPRILHACFLNQQVSVSKQYS